MNIVPIFMAGFMIGMLVTYMWYTYKKDISSDTRIHIQEAEIIRYKSDILRLEEKNEELTKENELLKNK